MIAYAIKYWDSKELEWQAGRVVYRDKTRAINAAKEGINDDGVPLDEILVVEDDIRDGTVVALDEDLESDFAVIYEVEVI